MASPRTVGLSAAENHAEHHHLTHAATAGSDDGRGQPVVDNASSIGAR
jgi:hypothetical protein